jgi:hypothetical protein
MGTYEHISGEHTCTRRGWQGKEITYIQILLKQGEQKEKKFQFIFICHLRKNSPSFCALIFGDKTRTSCMEMLPSGVLDNEN